MSKESTVKPAPVEVKAPDVAPPVLETNTPASVASTPSATKKPVATAPAKKAAPKSRVAKAVVAAKPAPTPKAPAKTVKQATVVAKVKKQTPKKAKLIRDSFTIPDSDYALFESLKQRALSAGIDVKKSEILRAALITLAQFDDAALVKAIGLVERIKTGRPKK